VIFGKLLNLPSLQSLITKREIIAQASQVTEMIQ
jgi:hypothetical protein